MSRLSELEKKVDDLDKSDNLGFVFSVAVLVLLVVYVLFFSFNLGIIPSGTWECVEEEQVGWEYKENFNLYQIDKGICYESWGFVCEQSNFMMSEAEYCEKNKLGKALYERCEFGRIPIIECTKEQLVRNVERDG